MSDVPDFQNTLLDKARQDADAARLMAGDRRFSDEIIGFHCQQAVEKAIKAVLETCRIQYPLTHDLIYLLALLGTHAPTAVPMCPVGIEDAMQLNPFAVRFRYESQATTPDPTFDRFQAVRTATVSVEWAASIMKVA